MLRSSALGVLSFRTRCARRVASLTSCADNGRFLLVLWECHERTLDMPPSTSHHSHPFRCSHQALHTGTVLMDRGRRGRGWRQDQPPPRVTNTEAGSPLTLSRSGTVGRAASAPPSPPWPAWCAPAYHLVHRLEGERDGPLADFAPVCGPGFGRFAEVEPKEDARRGILVRRLREAGIGAAHRGRIVAGAPLREGHATVLEADLVRATDLLQDFRRCPAFNGVARRVVRVR